LQTDQKKHGKNVQEFHWFYFLINIWLFT